jgi:hypothetical protein
MFVETILSEAMSAKAINATVVASKAFQRHLPQVQFDIVQAGECVQRPCRLTGPAGFRF